MLWDDRLFFICGWLRCRFLWFFRDWNWSRFGRNMNGWLVCRFNRSFMDLFGFYWFFFGRMRLQVNFCDRHFMLSDWLRCRFLWFFRDWNWVVWSRVRFGLVFRHRFNLHFVHFRLCCVTLWNRSSWVLRFRRLFGRSIFRFMMVFADWVCWFGRGVLVMEGFMVS